MNFKITAKIMDLVTELVKEGYRGTATICNNYCTGTKAVLGESFSIELSGFCKETLHLVEDEEGFVWCVGRYSTEDSFENPTVENIVDIAWDMFNTYESRGYSMPYEFESLFVKYGKIVKKVVTTETYERV